MFLGPSPAEAEAVKEKRRLQREWLEHQVKEKEHRLRQQKEAERRREDKIRKEAAGYNPWGRGGAGAPLRGNDGAVLTNMKQILKGGVAPKAEPLRGPGAVEMDEPPPMEDRGERSVPQAQPLPVEEDPRAMARAASAGMDPRALARAASAKVSPVSAAPVARVTEASPARAQGSGKRAYDGAIAAMHANPAEQRAKAEKRAQLVRALEEQVREKKERDEARKNREKERERVEHERMLREVPFGDAPSPRKNSTPHAPAPASTSPVKSRGRATSPRHGNNLAERRGAPQVRVVEPDVSEIPGLGGAPESHVSPIAMATAAASPPRDAGVPGFDIKRYVSRPAMSVAVTEADAAPEPGVVDPARTPPHVRAAQGRGFTPSPSPSPSGASRAARKSDSHLAARPAQPKARRETVAGAGARPGGRRFSKQEERTIGALADVESRLRAAEHAREMLSVRGNGGDALVELANLCKELVHEQKKLQSALAEQKGVVGQLVKSGLINGLVSDDMSEDGSDLPPVPQVKRRAPKSRARTRSASVDEELSLPPLGSKERREGGVRMGDKRRSVRIADEHSPGKPPKPRNDRMKERKASMERKKKQQRGPPKPTVPRKPKPNNAEERAAARRARIAARSAAHMDVETGEVLPRKASRGDVLTRKPSRGDALSRKPSRIPRSAGAERIKEKGSPEEASRGPKMRRHHSQGEEGSEGRMFRKRNTGIPHSRQGAARSAREKRTRSPRESTESRPKSAGEEPELGCKLLESESTFMFPNDPREQDLYTTDRWFFQMDPRTILNPTPSLEPGDSVEDMAETITRAASPRVVPSTGRLGFASLKGPFDAPHSTKHVTPPRSPIISPQARASNQTETFVLESSAKHHRSSTDLAAPSEPLPRKHTGPPPATADAQPAPLAREDRALEVEADDEVPLELEGERGGFVEKELPTEPPKGSPGLQEFTSAARGSEPGSSAKKAGRRRTKIKVIDPFSRR